MKVSVLVFVLCSTLAYGQYLNREMQRSQQALAEVAATITVTPSFSVKQGVVPSGTTVRINCKSNNAVIYYTTNGFTPTAASRHYTGPIRIKATTQLQAYAEAPGLTPSANASAVYTVKGTPPLIPPVTLGSDGVLHARTRLHLVTNSTVNSKTAKVGDKIGLLLNQDIKIGSYIVVPKGTPLDATLTEANHPGTFSRGGDLSFQVRSLDVPEGSITLQGGENLTANPHPVRTVLLWVSFVGTVPAIMIHGDQAEIKPGMKFTVAVTKDTPLKLGAALPPPTK